MEHEVSVMPSSCEYRKSPLFTQARQEALSIMSPARDPFHDDKHVLEVVSTVHEIYKALPENEQAKIDLEIVELAASFHDSSRKKIGSNLLMVPFFDEKYSGDIAYQTLVKVGYSQERAQAVERIIRGHARVGGIRRIDDINSQLASDADKVQVYNRNRFERGLKRFEDGEFPRYLLNVTVMALLPLRDKIPQLLHFEKAKELQRQYYVQLKEYLKNNKERITIMLYPPLAKRLYKSLEIA